MKITIYSFTHRGAALAASLAGNLIKKRHECHVFSMPKYAAEYNCTPMELSLQDSTAESFPISDALIYIGACGIAVRAIAPFVQDKTTDPCVVSIDEYGKYVIPLLSGHIGGGNELALEIADILHATPVISTATDLNHKFAVDVFASKNGLKISDMQLAKKISAAILDGEKIGISASMPLENVPLELTVDTKVSTRLGISISPFTDNAPYPETLTLVPRQIVLGIGCKKGISCDEMASFVERILLENQIHPASILAIASIDLKKDEPCLKALAAKYQVPFYTYTAETLSNAKGAFHSSAYVQKITGVDNVCERAAITCAGTDILTLPKTADNGKTIAIALAPLQLHF